MNVYGESKLEAEFRVREEMPDALVARVSWVFGNPGRPSFLEMVLRRAMKKGAPGRRGGQMVHAHMGGRFVRLAPFSGL